MRIPITRATKPMEFCIFPAISSYNTSLVTQRRRSLTRSGGFDSVFHSLLKFSTGRLFRSKNSRSVSLKQQEEESMKVINKSYFVKNTSKLI